ncbi:MAG: hypothetical protein RLZZ281_43, partial [Pseudomonadota bacterium]
MELGLALGRTLADAGQRCLKFRVIDLMGQRAERCASGGGHRQASG